MVLYQVISDSYYTLRKVTSLLIVWFPVNGAHSSLIVNALIFMNGLMFSVILASGMLLNFEWIVNLTLYLTRWMSIKVCTGWWMVPFYDLDQLLSKKRMLSLLWWYIRESFAEFSSDPCCRIISLIDIVLF